MRSFLDAKAMAKTLRQELSNRNIELGHSECLEVVAKQFGFRDWNVMAAELQEQHEFTPENRDSVEGLPEGWFQSGQGSDAFRVATVPDPESPTRLCITINSRENAKGGREPDPGDFCTVMQVISAEEFRGKRIAFRGELRTDAVRGSATVWMRVDDINGQMVAFDNREKAVANGALKGTNNWSPRQVILDIPPRGETIHFGFYLNGRGQAWIRGLEFEVTDDIPSSAGIARPKAPQNLDLKGA